PAPTASPPVSLPDALPISISGRAPAPSPRVSFLPIWIFRCDFEFFSACASVFTLMNSTPSRSSAIMRFTALPPPPPTPTTFMRAFCAAPSSNSKIIMVPSLGLFRERPPRRSTVASTARCECERECEGEFAYSHLHSLSHLLSKELPPPRHQPRNHSFGQARPGIRDVLAGEQ